MIPLRRGAPCHPGLRAPTGPRRAAPIPHLHLAALGLVAALLGGLLGGCFEGGTSTDAGNPGLVVGFRKDGKPVAFEGLIRVYAQGSNPGFYTPPPQDGSDPKVIIGPIINFGPARSNSLWLPVAREVQTIEGDFLGQAADYRVSFPILPLEMEGDEVSLGAIEGRSGLDPGRPFNIVFSDSDMSAFVQGIAIDGAFRRYRGPDGELLDTLWVDLHRDGEFTGTVDTAGLRDAPLIIFAPGSPYAARVHGDRFRLPDLPKARIPLRLVTAGGAVLSIPELLDATRRPDSGGPIDTMPALVLGQRIDSLVVPAPIPMLDPPTASPPGPHKFTEPVTVTLSAEPGAAIHFTRDGKLPGLHSERYTKPILLHASAVITAIAYRKGSNPSQFSLNSYGLVPVAPKAAPASQGFRDSLAVTLSTDAKNGIVLYTMDGSNPLAGSAVYSGPIVLKATTVLKAVTLVSGLELSPILEEHYILVTDTLPGNKQ